MASGTLLSPRKTSFPSTPLSPPRYRKGALPYNPLPFPHAPSSGTGTAPGGRLDLPPGADSVCATDACRYCCWCGVGSGFTAGRASPAGYPRLGGLPARRGRLPGTTGGLQMGSRGSRVGISFTPGSGGAGGRRRPRAVRTREHRYPSASASLPQPEGADLYELNRKCQNRPLLRNYCRVLPHGSGPRGLAGAASRGRFGACGGRLPLLLLE